MTKPQSSVIISEFGSYLHFASLPLLLFQIKVPDPGDLCYQGYEVTKVTRVTGVTEVIIAMKFSLQNFRIKRLRGYQGYQGYGGYNSHEYFYSNSWN